MPRRVLVANRGEIALRIIRACRSRGIETVATCSTADATAPHVRAADAHVVIGSADPLGAYLDIDAIVAAAQDAGCDALHPGYGFVSERPELVEACEQSGITFIGPPASAMRELGSKAAAKDVAARCSVPTVPTYPHDAVPADAFPVLVKASAGGGGRGMRRVDAPADLPAALEAAAREAEAGFGDATLLVERLVDDARHIEVQLLADAHGTALAIGDRDCSMQRRHQKVIEEAPAPGLAEDMRASLHEWTTELAREVGYVGAGTAEFLVSPDGSEAYFLELNARLQVEHTVTEEAFGIDLVEWQLRIAGGERLELAGSSLTPRAHSIQARIYAEDPVTMLPVDGELLELGLPDGAGIRIDHALEPGTPVDLRFDPMLAKLIATAPTRSAARQLLLAALARLELVGVEGNQLLLRELLRSPAFADARHTTATLDGLRLSPDDVQVDDALAAAVRDAWARRHGDAAGSYRSQPASPAARIRVARRGDTLHFTRDGIPGQVPLAAPPPAAATGEAGETTQAELAAPMPGTIVRITPSGTAVATGEPVVVLEAMKMENAISAPFDGVVADLAVAEGDQVSRGSLLARVVRA